MFEGYSTLQLQAFRPSEDGPRIHANIQNAIKFSWPYEVGRGQVEGFRLKGNKGYISLEEIYAVSNRAELSCAWYVYRYITEEYAIKWTKVDDGTFNSTDYFSFHYDKDPRHADNIHHLQAINNTPRFPTHPITVMEFLRTIDSFCFNSGTPINQALFLNRIT
jgi:hypothetical protein